MSAFKQFLASDIIVSPFEVNKSFSFAHSEFSDADVQIDRFLGVKGDFLSNKSTTGTNSTEYQVLVYDSIKELYYSNFLTSPTGSIAATSSLVPGSDSSGDRLIGGVSTTNYDNYLDTTLSLPRYIPTSVGDKIAAFSIPSRLFGDYIQPNSFIWEDNTTGVTLTDDGEGNIISGSIIIGNIIYSHGIVTITNSTGSESGGYGLGVYGTALYGASISTLIDNLITSTNVTCSFSSSYSIIETQYKTTLRENEFNFSLNPSLISGSEGDVYGFVTSSYFSPYVTTVGLYNDNQELLAIGKLSQPLPTSRTTDTNIFINIDR